MCVEKDQTGEGGGGSARVVKNQTAFLQKVFLREYLETCFTLGLGCPFVSTAVRTALKVARRPQILGERRPVSKNNKIQKRIDFEMGPSV